MTKIAVIGAGFAGLSAAACLAKEGFDVTVFEKNSTAGGRAREFEAAGYRFDMGPSWYWMPDVFDTFFARFGKKTSDFYNLIRLDPSYRIFFPGEVMDVPAGETALCDLFERTEKGSGKSLRKFLREGKYKYETGMQELVYKPGLSFKELIDIRIIKGIFKLHVFQSVTSYIKKYFHDRRLIQLLEFPALFLGAPAASTPALYTLMNYADMALGTWYPMGGMFKIIEGMVSLARQHNVKFEFNANVQSLDIQTDSITTITVNGKQIAVDFVIGAADYHHVEQSLLSREYRRYSEQWWQKRVMAPSCLIFYIGVNKKVKNLQHHNLFFDKDFNEHATEIYDQPGWPRDPLFYVCCTSKTDPSVAPAGHENLFILMPVAPGLEDTDAIRLDYFARLVQRLEGLTGENIREHIIYSRSYAHKDFALDYNAFKGNAYGLANTIGQTANLKPSIENKKVKNLLYAGQLTVPGPGMPPSLISGQVVADELIKRVKSNRLRIVN